MPWALALQDLEVGWILDWWCGREVGPGLGLGLGLPPWEECGRNCPHLHDTQGPVHTFACPGGNLLLKTSHRVNMGILESRAKAFSSNCLCSSNARWGRYYTFFEPFEILEISKTSILCCFLSLLRSQQAKIRRSKVIRCWNSGQRGLTWWLIWQLTRWSDLLLTFRSARDAWAGLRQRRDGEAAEQT